MNHLDRRMNHLDRWMNHLPPRGRPSSDGSPRTTQRARSDAGWVRREINCTAGWSCAGRSWRWHRPWVAIRRSTDERRAQTRGASKRVRVLQELRAGIERGCLCSWQRWGQTRVASKRVRGLSSGRAGISVEILLASPVALGAATPLVEDAVAGELASHLCREDGNAPRSDAGWVRREINCTAGWSSAGRSWRWHRQSLAIRRSTDERRAQPRVTSKRVRVLQELRAGIERGRLFSWQRWAQTRVASKRVRVLSNGRAGAADGIFIAAPQARRATTIQ